MVKIYFFHNTLHNRTSRIAPIHIKKYETYLKLVDSNYVASNLSQQMILDLFLECDEILKKSASKISVSSLKTLISKCVVEEFEREVYRKVINGNKIDSRPILNEEQENVVTSILNSRDCFQPFLRCYFLHFRILRRDDHLSRYDYADVCVRSDFLGAQPIQRKTKRGQGKQHHKGRANTNVVCHHSGHHYFLLYFKIGPQRIVIAGCFFAHKNTHFSFVHIVFQQIIDIDIINGNSIMNLFLGLSAVHRGYLPAII